MNRREFITAAAAAGAALGLACASAVEPNTHGLDDEGWGPIRATYLERLLERLLSIESVDLLPAGRALAKYVTAG